MRRIPILVWLLLAGLLAACSGQPAALTATPAAASGAATGDTALTRADSQGSVEFAVTPLNLSAPGETLDFDMSMNTHSVELSWDLAGQSTLTTDTGREVQGQSWPGGSGHHVEGVLSFPAQTVEGQPLLEGASRLTLVIRGTDVPERTFSWDLSP
jgi:hypothetical protein